MNRVLLADDNAHLRSALALLLETRLGMQVIGEASSMGELLGEVAARRPQAVVLDWELPGEPASGRVAALRLAEPGVIVIVTSARPESAAQACEDQADAFINKTDPPEVILATFRALTARSPRPAPEPGEAENKFSH
jgi:two-component system response regulator DesR